MIRVVNYENRNSFESLLDDMHVARHRLYVEGRKWRELAKADGREIDEFDRDSTVYFLSVGHESSLQGGLRLVPTTERHMLDSLFPELCADGRIPKGPNIWEMSRVFVNHSDACDGEGLQIKGKLMCAMIEFAQLNGIEKITGVADSYFLPRLLQTGANIKPLGLPHAYESGEMLALQIVLDETTLGKMQKHYGIPRQMLNDDARQTDYGPLYPDLDIAQLNDEIELLKDKGFVSDREQFIEEFVSIVQQLSANDKKIVMEAEVMLDDLERRIRNSNLLTGRSTVVGSMFLQ